MLIIKKTSEEKRKDMLKSDRRCFDCGNHARRFYRWKREHWLCGRCYRNLNLRGK